MQFRTKMLQYISFQIPTGIWLRAPALWCQYIFLRLTGHHWRIPQPKKLCRELQTKPTQMVPSYRSFTCQSAWLIKTLYSSQLMAGLCSRNGTRTDVSEFFKAASRMIVLTLVSFEGLLYLHSHWPLMSNLVNITSPLAALQDSPSQVSWWKLFTLRKHHRITDSLFYNFRRKTFNDEKRSFISKRSLSTSSFILSAQDSLEKLQSWLQRGKWSRGYLGSHDCSQRQVEYCGASPSKKEQKKPAGASEWQIEVHIEVQPCYHTSRINKQIFSSLQLCGKALHLRCSKTMTIYYESSTDTGISCHSFQLLRLLSKLHYNLFSLPVRKWKQLGSKWPPWFYVTIRRAEKEK